MTEYKARKIVAAVTLVMVVVVFWENLVNTGRIIPPAKTVVVMLMLITGLTVGASIAPDIVGPMALLIGIAVAISRVPASPGPFLKKYAGATPPTVSGGPKQRTTGTNYGEGVTI